MPDPSSHDRPAVSYSSTSVHAYLREITSVTAIAHPNIDGHGRVEIAFGDTVRLVLSGWRDEGGRVLGDLARALTEAARWIDGAAGGDMTEITWPPPAPEVEQ